VPGLNISPEALGQYSIKMGNDQPVTEKIKAEAMEADGKNSDLTASMQRFAKICKSHCTLLIPLYQILSRINILRLDHSHQGPEI